MKNLNQKTSTMAWIRALLYLMARLARERPTRHLIAPLRNLVERFDRVAAATSSADRIAVAARGNADAADADLDELIVAFETNLLLSVAKNRKSVLYRKIFPEGLTRATRATIDDQIRAARRLEEAIADELPDKPFARDALPRIRAAREELERQFGALQSAIDRLNAARCAERAVRVEAGALYRITYAELLKLFPENLRKVRSFFRPSRDAGVDEEEPEAPETPENEAAESSKAPGTETTTEATPS